MPCVVHKNTELITSFMIIDDNGDVIDNNVTKLAISKLCKEDFNSALEGLLQVKKSLITEVGNSLDISSKVMSLEKKIGDAEQAEVNAFNKLIDKIVELDETQKKLSLEINQLNKKSEETDIKKNKIK